MLSAAQPTPALKHYIINYYQNFIIPQVYIYSNEVAALCLSREIYF